MSNLLGSQSSPPSSSATIGHCPHPPGTQEWRVYQLERVTNLKRLKASNPTRTQLLEHVKRINAQLDELKGPRGGGQQGLTPEEKEINESGTFLTSSTKIGSKSKTKVDEPPLVPALKHHHGTSTNLKVIKSSKPKVHFSDATNEKQKVKVTTASRGSSRSNTKITRANKSIKGSRSGSKSKTKVDEPPLVSALKHHHGTSTNLKVIKSSRPNVHFSDSTTGLVDEALVVPIPAAPVLKSQTSSSSGSSGAPPLTLNLVPKDSVKIPLREINVNELMRQGKVQVTSTTSSSSTPPKKRQTESSKSKLQFPEAPKLGLCNVLPGTPEWDKYWKDFNTKIDKFDEDVKAYDENMSIFKDDLEKYRKRALQIQEDERIISTVFGESPNSIPFKIEPLPIRGLSWCNGYVISNCGLKGTLSSNPGSTKGLRIELDIRGVDPDKIQKERKFNRLTVRLREGQYLEVGTPPGRIPEDLEVWSPIKGILMIESAY